MKFRALLLLLCTTSLTTPRVFAEEVKPAKSHFKTENNVAVPMRDGILLRADILRPSAGEKFPVLVYRTPYGKDAAQREYTTFKHAVERGYAVVIVDVRGRYHSE